MAEVKQGHSSVWQICSLIPQKGLHCLAQCSSSGTAVKYKIHELLPIRNDHLCRKMSSQEAGGALPQAFLPGEDVSIPTPHSLLLTEVLSCCWVIQAGARKDVRSCNDCIQQRVESCCLPVVLSRNRNTYKGSDFRCHPLLFPISAYKCVCMHAHTCTPRVKPR